MCFKLFYVIFFKFNQLWNKCSTILYVSELNRMDVYRGTFRLFREFLLKPQKFQTQISAPRISKAVKFTSMNAIYIGFILYIWKR